MTRLKEQIATRTVNVEDVDDIIGVAAELMQADEQTLTLQELEEVGHELDIPAEYIDRAIQTLKQRRENEARARTLAVARRRKVRLAAVVVSIVLVFLLAILAFIGQANLRSSLAEVELKQAQVRSVMQRQLEVQARYQDLPATPDRDAELSGAQNRVYVERQRYDQAATSYNESAGGLLGGLWTTLFRLPDRVPLSGEIDEW
ncbi:MAG: hypothetical protein JW797_12320 [Bradymonadales bacterium]|nr:hypothetical protein [Bradymonadales bacterium]